MADRFRIAGPAGLLLLGAGLAALTACLILYAYPASYITGSHPFWQDPTGDLAQHSTGANYFIRSDWGFPLFHVPELGIPGGTSIVYTDSLPLMALVYRVIYMITGEAHLYFSHWIFLSALLQAPCFALALYAAGVRNAAVLALGGLMALFAPVWLFGFNHLQLFGHFMILIAVALYFFSLRTENWLRVMIWFLPLMVLAMTVSGYIFFMTGMTFGLAVLSGVWREKTGALGALAGMAVAGGTCLAVLVAGGYLGTELVPKNYGMVSLNLLGFVLPQLSGIVPGLDDYVVDATGGQSQGFAYLGLGALLLLAVALWQGRRDLAAAVKADPTLLFGCLAILLYAASYAVYAGPVLIAGIPHDFFRQAFLGVIAGEMSPREALGALGALDYARLAFLGLLAAAIPAGLAAMAWRQSKRQFLLFIGILAGLALAALIISPKTVLFSAATLHASGRFSWLLVYLVMVLAIAGLARRISPLPLAGLMALALLIQVIDSGPAQRGIRKQIAAGGSQPFAGAREIEAALRGADRFILSPKLHCAVIENDDRHKRKAVRDMIVRLEFLGSKQAIPINSVLNARLTAQAGFIDLPDCDSERARAVEGGWGAGSVYFFLKEATPADVYSRLSADTARCRALTHGLLCGDP